MESPSGEKPRPDTEARSRGRAYDRLREAILSLGLLPGEAVSERALERLLGVSRTPIREALRRLEGEGLVERRGRGYRVSPIDLAELLEVLEYREIVEAAVVRLACARAEPRELDRIQARLDSGVGDDTAETWFEIGSDVHLSIARLSGNRFLERAMEDVITRISRARWMMATSAMARASAHSEHSRIVWLIAERRPDEAEAAIVAHGRHVRDTLVEAVREGQRGFRARGADVVE